MSLVVKSVARDNQKTVTFSSFDEWHTWEADALRIDPVGVDVTPQENIETRQKMKEVGKNKNKNRTTSIATDEPINGASASSGSVIGEVVNTSTLRSNKLKKITSFRNVVAEKKKAGTKEILSSFIDNDVKLYSSAPVQQLDVIPDPACDVSLLSNELEGNKLKIWDEDESVESRLPGTNILTKACMTVVDINRRCESSAEEFIFPPASSGMTCKDGISDTERKRHVRWTSSATTDDDDDDDSDDDNDDDETSIGDVEHGSLFSCGTETQRIKENLGDLGNDVQSGIAHAVRRLLLLLGSYDITRDELQLDVTNQKSKSKQKYCGDEVGTPTSINVTDKQKRFLVKLKELATNAVGLKHDEKNMGKPKTAIDKRKMYVQKLKEMSLRHV